jgi:hypothetical protein
MPLNNLNKYVSIMELCKVQHRLGLQQTYCMYPKHILKGPTHPAGWQNRPRCLTLDDDGGGGGGGGGGGDSNDLLKHDSLLSYINFLRAMNSSAPTCSTCSHRNFCLQLHAHMLWWPHSSHPCKWAGLAKLRKLVPKTGLYHVMALHYE